MKHLVVIVGPTAIGKTSLSIELAQYFNTEIISADSRQFYKEMAIGTAKPTPDELAQAPHHFVDFLNVTDEYNAGKFEQDAILKLEELFKNHDVVIMVGGSGLYVDAVCYGIDDIPSDPIIREQLNNELIEKGLETLQEELKAKDPKHYSNSNIKNPQRVIRALEVCRITGKSYSEFRNNSKKKRNFNIIKIGLNDDRETVYNRINQRVDIMMNKGLLEEVKKLHNKKYLNSLNTVGYKELFKHIDEKEFKLTEAIELIKKNTRNFAKRQLTWFRKDPSVKWFKPQQKNEIISYVQSTTEQS